MKQEEMLTSQAQTRLTESALQSYAKSMPNTIDVQEVSPVESPPPALKPTDPDQVMKDISEHADKVLADAYKKVADENKESEKQAANQEAEDKTSPTNPSAEATPETVKTVEATTVPRTSIFSKVFEAFSGTEIPEKVVQKAKKFNEEAEGMKDVKLEKLKEQFQDWEPDTKNKFVIVVSRIAQHEIIQEVKRRNVSTDIFIQAAYLDMPVPKQEALDEVAEATAGSRVVDDLVQRFITKLDDEPIATWKAEEVAEELVDIRHAAAEVNETPEDQKIISLLETVILQQAAENNIPEPVLTEAIVQVEKAKTIPESPQKIVQEDRVVEAPAVFEPTAADILARRGAIEGKDEIIEPEPFVQITAKEDVAMFKPVDEERPVIHSFAKDESYPRMPEVYSYGNDPDVAEVLFRAWNGGKPLTPEQQAKADEGAAPLIGGGAPGGEFEPTRMGAGKGRGGGGRGGGGGQRQLSLEQKEQNLRAQNAAETEAFESQADELKGSVAAMSEDELKGIRHKINPQLRLAIRAQTWGEKDPAIRTQLQNQLTADFNAHTAAVDAEIAAGNIDRARDAAVAFVEWAKNAQQGAKTKEMEKRIVEKDFGSETVSSTPQNMHDIARLIAEGSIEFQTGGDHELIDKNDNFIEENFMYWVQQKFLYFHEQDPDSSQQFFDLIQIENENLFRTVSINAMLRNQELYFKTEENEPLEGLFRYLTDFVWLVGAIRNTNTEYIQQMGSEDKIGELIAAVMKSNVLTKRSATKDNTLEAVASLTSKFRDWENVSRLVDEIADPIKGSGRKIDKSKVKLKESDRLKVKGVNPTTKSLQDYAEVEAETQAFLDEVEKIKAKEQDIDVGDGVAMAYLMYYNMADHDYLKDRFGGLDNDGKQDTHLLKREGMEAVLRKVARVAIGKDDPATAKKKMFEFIVRGKLDSNIEKNQPKYANFDEWAAGWYGADGNLKSEEAIAAFISMFNIFEPAQKNLNQIDIANGLIQLAVGERLAKNKPPKPEDNTLDKKLDSVMKNEAAKFSSLLASFMTFFTGAAAKNDLGVAATNAAAKPRYINNYKKKSGEPQRAGGFGNIYNFGTINQSYVDMMVGLPTVSGKSILEVFEEKAKAVKDKKSFAVRQEIAHQLLFNQNDAKQYGVAGPPNQVKIYQQEIEGKEIDFHKFVHVDAYGHVSYKPDAMLDALQDAIIKPTRYAWNTNKVPFHKEVRILLDNEEKPPRFRTGTQLEEMFSPQLLRVIEDTYMSANKNDEKVKQEFVVRRFLTKKGTVVRYKVNADKKFVDKHNNVLDPKTDKEWYKKAVEDEHGALDPNMMRAWDDTSFRRCVVKGYLLNRFAGQLYGHTSSHSPYEYMDYGLREDVIRGLMKIPILPEDHGDFDSRHVGGSYFTKEDIKLLRRLSNNRLGKNILLALGRDLRMGFFDGLKEFWSRFVKAVNVP